MVLTPHIRYFVIVLSILLQLTGAAKSQALPDSLLVSGSVPGVAWTMPDVIADSLQLVIVDYAIELAAMEESRTSFWHRLIPDLRVSANIGVQQLVFVDPSAFAPYVLPRDAYRLTVSLSLSDVFDFGKHTAAQIKRAGLEVQRQFVARRLQKSQTKTEHERTLLQQDVQSLKEQEALINDLVRYKQILFDRGDIQFDELVRARLQRLQIKHAIGRLVHSLGDFQQEP